MILCQFRDLVPVGLFKLFLPLEKSLLVLDKSFHIFALVLDRGFDLFSIVLNKSFNVF